VGSDCGGYRALAVELQELDRQAILRLEQLVLHELDLRTQRRRISAPEWSVRLNATRTVRAEHEYSREGLGRARFRAGLRARIEDGLCCRIWYGSTAVDGLERQGPGRDDAG
jgi:hypothetical protein